MSKKFKHLNISPHWQQYFSKYPQGYTIIENLIDWVSQVDDMVDNVNDWNEYLVEFVEMFDTNLQTKVTETLMEWQNSGFLDVVISEALQWQLDDYITTNEQDKLSLTTQLDQLVVNVKNFGAVGDGITDDAPAIRSAYEHLKTLGGGTLFFPDSGGAYMMNSTVSHSGLEIGLAHDQNSVIFEGASEGVGIQAGVSMHALIYGTTRTNYMQFKNIYLDGQKLADYCFNTDEVYTPYASVTNCRFYNAKEISFRILTFMSTFSKSIFSNSKIGLRVRGVEGNIATSCTFNSCYALDNVEIGFEAIGLMYSTFNSCAVDNMPNGIAYAVDGRGVSFNSCGAEKVRQPFKASSFRGLSINTFFGFDNGSLDENNPTEYMFEFVTGSDATVNGLHFHEGAGRHYDYKLGLTKSNYGFENITVLDASIRRNEAYFVSNYTFERPIKFIRGDETVKNQTVTINVEELSSYLKGIEHMEINHILTINLNDGIQEYPSNNFLTGLKGVGKIIIQGNENDIRAVELNGTWRRTLLTNCAVTIEFKDVTFTNASSGGSLEFALVTVDNCRKVIFNSIGLDVAGANVGAGIRAMNGSEVYIVGDIEFYDFGTIVHGKYVADDTSTIHDKTSE